MDGLSQNTSFLTVSGSIMASGNVKLQSVGLTSPGQSFYFEASGGGDWLRTDVVRLAEKLLRSAQGWRAQGLVFIRLS
jgi:hypothetical protein